MREKSKIQKIPVSYDYYASIKEKSDKFGEKFFNTNDEINKSKLYQLFLNICNQVVYDYSYSFTSHDMFFLAEYDINIFDIINSFIEDILIMKQLEQE